MVGERISRRKFLGTSASAAAFTIVSRHVLGGAGVTAPSEKVNIAGIGIWALSYQGESSELWDGIKSAFDDDTYTRYISMTNGNNLVIYPNPCSMNRSKIEVLLPMELMNKKFDVHIFNSIGNVIYCDILYLTKTLNISMKDIPAGLYHIIITCYKKSYTVSFVIY